MKNIANLRKKNGLTQLALAQKLNVSRSTVAMWELGKSEPSNDILKEMSNIFNVSSDFLLDIEASEKTNPETLQIAKRVTERRTELNITREELAEKIGVSKSTMQRYESGAVQHIPFEKLEKIADALNTTVETLSGYEEEEKKAEYLANIFTVLLQDEELLNTVLSLLRVKENSEDSYRNLTALIKGMSK